MGRGRACGYDERGNLETSAGPSGHWSFSYNRRNLLVWAQSEAGVVVEAGSTFGLSTAGFLRLDLGVPAATLTLGVERMASFAERGRAA